MKRLLAVVVVVACSDQPTVHLCQSDADCGAGDVCEVREDQPVCIAATEAPIRIGHTAAVTGTNQGPGQGLKLGIDLAFAEQNALGGIRGRQLVLEFRDDAYMPELANAAARELVDAQASPGTPPKCPSSSVPMGLPIYDTALSRGPNAVLAMLGSFGSPPSQQAAAIAIETGTIYFAPVAGNTSFFRDSYTGACSRYLFNVRASYAQEARATLELFMANGVGDYRNLISFDQNDPYGDSGYYGLVAAYTQFVGPFPTTADPTFPIKRFRYTRNDDSSVPAQAVAIETYLADLLTNQSGTVSVGVLMTDTYGAAATLITQIRFWQYANDAQQTTLQKATRLELYFSNVSFVGPNALSERIVAAGMVQTPMGQKSFADGVYVSQVVPNYAGDPSSLVADYNRAITGKTPSYISLEGYLNARVLIAALLAHEGPFTPDALAATLEQLGDLSVGLDGTYGFSPQNHQYSNAVWGTKLEADGAFTNLYVWREGSPIQIAP